MMDFAKALTFLIEDERWMEKIGIGTAIALVSFILSPVLIGFLGFAILVGYGFRLMRNVQAEVPKPLPEWGQWGDDLARGFKYMVVTFLWALPIIIVSGILGLIAGGMRQAGDAGDAVGALVSLFSSCISFIYGIGVAVMTPGIVFSFARNEQIGSGLKFGEIWAWTRENLGHVITLVLVVMVGSILIFLVGGIVGTILCLVGLVVTLPLAMLVANLFQFHLYGQLARAHPFEDPVMVEPSIEEPPVAGSSSIDADEPTITP